MTERQYAKDGATYTVTIEKLDKLSWNPAIRNVSYKVETDIGSYVLGSNQTRFPTSWNYDMIFNHVTGLI